MLPAHTRDSDTLVATLPGVMGSVQILVGPVSVHQDRVR